MLRRSSGASSQRPLKTPQWRLCRECPRVLAIPRVRSRRGAHDILRALYVRVMLPLFALIFAVFIWVEAW